MCRRNGVNYSNYGLGGASTRSYLIDKINDVINAEANSLYIFALGINDAGMGTSYIGSVSDMTSDYTQNPDTFYGNYARIIEMTMNHAPNAKFVILKLQVDCMNFVAYNEAIENIATHYNIPLIDPRNDKYYTDPVYSNMIGGHPTLLGYSCASFGIERLLNKCFNNNIDYFKYSNIS